MIAISNDAFTASIAFYIYPNDFSTASRRNTYECFAKPDGNQTYVGHTFIFHLQYTKASDQAVSIGDANEYSTSEKIIGTWVDGKPIYQKTFTGTSGGNGTDATFGSISNAETIVSLRGIVRNSNNMMHAAPNPVIYLKYYNGNIQTYTSDAQFGNQPCSITVQYTKTT